MSALPFVLSGIILLLAVSGSRVAVERPKATKTLELSTSACSWPNSAKKTVSLRQYDFDVRAVSGPFVNIWPIVVAAESVDEATSAESRVWQFYTNGLQGAFPARNFLGSISCGAEKEKAWLTLVAVQGHWILIEIYDLNLDRPVSEILPTPEMLKARPIGLSDQTAPIASANLDIVDSACSPDRLRVSRNDQSLDISLSYSRGECPAAHIAFDLDTKKFGPLPKGWRSGSS